MPDLPPNRERAGEAMIDAQKLAEHAGFSKFHQRQLRFLIARMARLAYSDGLEDAARECELAEPIEPTMDALAAAIRAMKTANGEVSGAGTASG